MTDSKKTGANDKVTATVIKKYANRRLYDTSRSSYITLEDLQAMLKRGEDFVVYDAKSGEDITRSVLAQIIIDEETHGENLLPLDFMKSIIQMYGQNMNQILPQYLQHSMQVFNENQDQIQSYFKNAFKGPFSEMFDMRQLEEVSRKNIEMFEKTFGMMPPFPQPFAKDGKKEEKEDSGKIDQMAAQLEALQAELNKLKKG